MGFQGSEIYPADPATTFAMFCDPDVAVARYEQAGDRDIEVLEVGPDGDGFVIRTKRTVEVDLPGFAKKVLSPTNSMTQTDRWGPAAADGSRDGTWEVDVAGAPVEIHGSMRLEPADGGTRHSVQGETTVKIPLIGGKVAKWSEGTAREQLDAELAFNRARLAAM